MLDAHKTQIALEKFFKDCFNYWKRTGSDERQAFEYALDDVKNAKRDPFTPAGQLLDPIAKANFIRYREMDLGKLN